jgi:hypothetical protein
MLATDNKRNNKLRNYYLVAIIYFNHLQLIILFNNVVFVFV